ncbi:MAG: adenosylmethionine decarboxylase [Thiolinea sp.]
MIYHQPVMQLQGFNNLTKTLSFNSYNVAYTPATEHRVAWQNHIAGHYSCERLTQILSEVAAMIDANILNIAQQVYEPQGTSVTMLLADQLSPGSIRENNYSGLLPEYLVAHLDKSHLTVHTYPESEAPNGISTVRVDIDVSTCGRISPLKALNYLIRSLESDIVTSDYRVRGFTRDVEGKKHFIDHKINSIQNFMAPDVLCRYSAEDVNLCRESIFHTRMVLKAIDIKDYLFGQCMTNYSAAVLQQIKQSVLEEMTEIFHGEGH